MSIQIFYDDVEIVDIIDYSLFINPNSKDSSLEFSCHVEKQPTLYVTLLMDLLSGTTKPLRIVNEHFKYYLLTVGKVSYFNEYANKDTLNFDVVLSLSDVKLLPIT